MEENNGEENKVPYEEELPLNDEEYLDSAEKMLADGDAEGAQKALDCVNAKSARKHYLQGKLYLHKCWYSEARKQFKSAVKAEPDNELYKTELSDIMEFSKTKEYRQAVRQKQMGEAGGVCAEGLSECCCLCICEGICEGLGNC